MLAAFAAPRAPNGLRRQPLESGRALALHRPSAWARHGVWGQHPCCGGAGLHTHARPSEASVRARLQLGLRSAVMFGVGCPLPVCSLRSWAAAHTCHGSPGIVRRRAVHHPRFRRSVVAACCCPHSICSSTKARTKATPAAILPLRAGAHGDRAQAPPATVSYAPHGRRRAGWVPISRSPPHTPSLR